MKPTVWQYRAQSVRIWNISHVRKVDFFEKKVKKREKNGNSRNKSKNREKVENSIQKIEKDPLYFLTAESKNYFSCTNELFNGRVNLKDYE